MRHTAPFFSFSFFNRALSRWLPRAIFWKKAWGGGFPAPEPMLIDGQAGSGNEECLRLKRRIWLPTSCCGSRGWISCGVALLRWLRRGQD